MPMQPGGEANDSVGAGPDGNVTVDESRATAPRLQPKGSHAMSTSKPHDGLFATAMSRIDDAQGILAVFLPEAVRRKIDWSTLQRLSGSFVSPELSAVHSDALFEVKLAGRDALLFLLLEHQSTPDPWMPLRMLVYVTEALRRYQREHAEATKLPVIVPMVLHHGDASWTTPRSLLEMWNADAETLDALGPKLMHLELAIDDLAHVPEEEIRQRSATDFARLVLLLLQQLRETNDAVGLLRSWQSHLERIALLPHATDALVAIWMYTLTVGRASRAELATLAKQLGPKAEEGLMTGAELLRKEGRVEGEARGRAETLLRLLRKRFGALSPAQETRLRMATTDELDAWTDLVLTATSLDELGL